LVRTGITLGAAAYAGNTTTYVYGADGTRLKKVEGSDVTAYFGPVEIWRFGQGAAEEVVRTLLACDIPLIYPDQQQRAQNRTDEPRGDAKHC